MGCIVVRIKDQLVIDRTIPFMSIILGNNQMIISILICQVPALPVSVGFPVVIFTLTIFPFGYVNTPGLALLQALIVGIYLGPCIIVSKLIGFCGSQVPGTPFNGEAKIHDFFVALLLDGHFAGCALSAC